jgi:rSAM/selenodomain-associated transferase 1
VIVGKAPEPGTTKTRLCPPLSLEQAAHLYRGFLHDIVSMALGLGWGRVTLIYANSPGADRQLADFLPAELYLQPQAGEGLGSALAGAFEHHFAMGYGRVVLIGSDNPTLPAEIVEGASKGLNGHDLVIGPSTDGGYYLVGMASPHLRIFDRISWSTDAVYRETLDRAHELGLNVMALPEWYDVDTAADLKRLRDELANLPPSIAPATRAALADIRL